MYDFHYAMLVADACNDPCGKWTNEVRKDMESKWNDINAIKHRIGSGFNYVFTNLAHTPNCDHCTMFETHPRPEECAEEVEHGDNVVHEYIETVVFWDKVIAVAQDCELAQGECTIDDVFPEPLRPAEYEVDTNPEQFTTVEWNNSQEVSVCEEKEWEEISFVKDGVEVFVYENSPFVTEVDGSLC